MKKLLLLSLLGIWGTTAFAQHINVVSTDPVNGAFNVDQDSIVLVFDAPIQFDTQNPYESGFNFVVEPEDSLNYTQIKISEDSMTVTFKVDLAVNTDYFGVLLGVTGKNGESLETPHAFQFTTADQAGLYTVNGTLDPNYLENHDDYSGIIMSLSALPLDLGINDGEEVDSSEGSRTSEGLSPLYVTNVNLETGAYSIAGVREGDYYPTAINAVQIAENEGENKDGFFFDIFIYDPNEDLEQDQISVTPTTTTADVLSGIDLRFLDTTPLLFSEALEIAKLAFVDFENDPVIMGGVSNYYFLHENFPDNPANQPSNFNWPEMNISFSQNNPALTSPHSRKKSGAFPALPDGTNLIWEFYAYDAVKDSALSLMVLPFGTLPMGYFSEEDVELEVEFSSIKPLPENVLDSDQVMAIAKANGGAEFMAAYNKPDPNGSREVEIDMSVLHEYWTYTPDPTPNAPQFWKVSYYTSFHSYETEEYHEDSLLVYMDISNGNVLLQTSIERNSEIPIEISLNQNYPNPFNPNTTISFTLNKSTNVELNVYNLLGQKIATLVNERYPSGVYSVQWDARNMASGFYIYRLKAGGVTHTRKMLLMK